MTTDDLRTRARAAAVQEFPGNAGTDLAVTEMFRDCFARGFRAHAAQQPSREQIARAIHASGGITKDLTPEHCSICREALRTADDVLALLNGEER